MTNVVDNGKIYTVVFPNGLGINPGYRVASDPSCPGIGNNYRRTLYVLGTLKPDTWLFPHTKTYDFEGRLARSKTEGVNAWVDPEGYRSWLVAQREELDTEVNRELGVSARKDGPPRDQTRFPGSLLTRPRSTRPATMARAT